MADYKIHSIESDQRSPVIAAMTFSDDDGARRFAQSLLRSSREVEIWNGRFFVGRLSAPDPATLGV